MSDGTDPIEEPDLILRPQNASRFYYVDEAGDPVLFGAKGQVRIGTEGCSSFFMLGKLDVPDPEALAAALTGLRMDLLDDPYFRNVPSMQPERRKTALMFHAKDDVAEVRREVFKLLLGFDLRFYAVVHDKQKILEAVRKRNAAKKTYRYTQNELYDRCVPRLLDGRLHKDSAYRIVFATRGSNPRTAAFEQGVVKAKKAFQRRHGIESVAPVEVVASSPAKIVCLQAVDYFLWALQRAFERGEHRFLDLVWPKVGRVLDADDHRQTYARRWYDQRNPLTEGFREGVAHEKSWRI